jgi:Fur family ferric uptake transcriptional regulator
MATSHELQTTLKAHGLRMTPQRQLILDAIASMRGHISADVVHQQVAERFPNVNISTVYRTLELLQNLGLVTHTHFDDGITQYHLAEQGAHQHLVCRQCASEVELNLSILQPLAEQLRRDFGFEPDLAHFAIVGVCRNCSARHRDRNGANGRRDLPHGELLGRFSARS